VLYARGAVEVTVRELLGARIRNVVGATQGEASSSDMRVMGRQTLTTRHQIRLRYSRK
jgi:hypothetical protein